MAPMESFDPGRRAVNRMMLALGAVAATRSAWSQDDYPD